MNRPVINVPQQNLANRRDLQTAILEYLATMGGPEGDRIGHLPRTGDVVDAVGRQRDNAGFATVSRSLARLRRDGRVVAFQPSLLTRGKGFFWALARYS